MPELVAGAEGAPPLRVVREGAGGEPAHPYRASPTPQTQS
jgi:hypothetical protein